MVSSAVRQRISCKVYRFSDSNGSPDSRESQTTTQPHRKHTSYHIRAWFDDEKEKKYEIVRRYSEFRKLHELLRAKCPEAAGFRFPRKSKFHTHSTFTKERRLDGFNEYLQMLCNLNPQPSEVYDFLFHDQKAANLEPEKNSADALEKYPSQGYLRGVPEPESDNDNIDRLAEDVDENTMMDDELDEYESELEQQERELSSWIIFTGAIAVLLSWFLRARSETDVMPTYGALAIFLSWGSVVRALHTTIHSNS
uniref:PX domain-containing protein n=1 Tax=Octactis speculum TaxID=3111310 RepID=A0A7S2MDG1_9STRA|mmetsp:Transcript_60098/g.82333  ORF Transcript_60098/g.82333 Transcript_60098/m.82333 type:complete len:253 (+) Transcript_60098:74-832(+)|eukprot:CAMPEP_0185772714 /NCGR_PEP_ID=MMETSP1174-20130828/70418_1 /TAXON_ID=35687 /ORGANISM="Dictyocha speculum, Strain CCMP1381" /LENGTH=252 /DNA_ID=CAMNT_0028459119 /DNA_START=69 /DNA_END=827 /DNA_ORIENTATION=+